MKHLLKNVRSFGLSLGVAALLIASAAQPTAGNSDSGPVSALGSVRLVSGLRPSADDNGNAVYRPGADDNGNAVYRPGADDNGNAVYKPSADDNGNAVYKPSADDNGNAA